MRRVGSAGGVFGVIWDEFEILWRLHKNACFYGVTIKFYGFLAFMVFFMVCATTLILQNHCSLRARHDDSRATDEDTLVHSVRGKAVS
jgi:hypothetical protein